MPQPTDVDVVKLKFRNDADLEQEDLAQFLREHWDGVRNGAGRKTKAGRSRTRTRTKVKP